MFHISKYDRMIAALLAIAAVLSVSRPAPGGDKPEKDDVAADEVFRREAEKIVGEIDLEVLRGDSWTRVQRIEKALLYYGDPTRDNDRGSVWAWGRNGRPVALLELFQNVNERRKWYFCICNTSGGKLRATRAGAPWWRENDSAAELKDVPNAPAPSSDARKRQRELKRLAQKFTGHEFWDPGNTRYELRRLDRPLHTYRDEAAGVRDGALFTVANGTNPEILFFVEARVAPKDKKKPVWQYAVGRLSHAEIHLEYDGKEIHSAPRGWGVSGPDKPYWSTTFATKPDKE